MLPLMNREMINHFACLASKLLKDRAAVFSHLPVGILIVSRNASWNTSRTQRSQAAHMTSNWIVITATWLGKEHLE